MQLPRLQRRLSVALLLLVVSALGACALSPMQVTLDPAMSQYGPPVGASKQIWVDVYDQRSSDVVGERGGVYRESSVTRLANAPEQAIQQVLVEAYKRMGFVVQGPQVDNVVSVFLEELRFGSLPDEISSKVVMSVRFRVEAKNSTGVYSNSYAGSGEKMFAIAPGRDATEKHLNQLVSDTLARLVQDKALADFLTR